MVDDKCTRRVDQTANGSPRAASGLVTRQIWIGVVVG
jgi:hypothetical protein